jgi:hypothetical protein
MDYVPLVIYTIPLDGTYSHPSIWDGIVLNFDLIESKSHLIKGV